MRNINLKAHTLSGGTWMKNLYLKISDGEKLSPSTACKTAKMLGDYSKTAT
jgi:hypothetical protein